MSGLRTLLLAPAFGLMAACASTGATPTVVPHHQAVSEDTAETLSSLRGLPAPNDRISVAVYGFEDQTGQFKPSSTTQTLSKAVSQGSTSILVKALQDAGDRSWFTVIERENLDNLLKERQIIREMRKQYLGEAEINPEALPPLLFAGVLLEGGIIGYDTNTRTGGLGARFLGIGGKADYREDKVTVYLRAVSVKNGEVITSVVASKKIASVGVAANAFRYVAFKELLEVDTGITNNEPDLLALRQAIEKAVELLILEGADLGVWGFEDRIAGAEVLEQYRLNRDGSIEEADLQKFAEQGYERRTPRKVGMNGSRRSPQRATAASATRSVEPTETETEIEVSATTEQSDQHVAHTAVVADVERKAPSQVNQTAVETIRIREQARQILKENSLDEEGGDSRQSENAYTHQITLNTTCFDPVSQSMADPHSAIGAAASAGGYRETGDKEACRAAAFTTQTIAQAGDVITNLQGNTLEQPVGMYASVL